MNERRQPPGRIPPALAVALGAMVGTSIRWIGEDLAGDHRSRAVVVVNLVGSALIGILAGRRVDESDGPWWPLLAIGFCGGLTTFSSFALDIAIRLDVMDWSVRSITDLTAVLVATVVGTVVSAGLGYRIGRRR